MTRVSGALELRPNQVQALATDTPGADPTPAVALCRTSPFLQPCRAWSLEHDVRGVWGGLTGEERDHGRPAGAAVPAAVSDELDALVHVWRASESAASRRGVSSSSLVDLELVPHGEGAEA